MKTCFHFLTFEHIVELIFIIAVLEAFWIDTKKDAYNFGFYMVKENWLVSLAEVLYHLFYALQLTILHFITIFSIPIYLCSCKIGGLNVIALDDHRQIAVALFNPGFEHQRTYVLDRWERQASVGRHQQVFQTAIRLWRKLIIDRQSR